MLTLLPSPARKNQSYLWYQQRRLYWKRLCTEQAGTKGIIIIVFNTRTLIPTTAALVSIEGPKKGSGIVDKRWSNVCVVSCYIQCINQTFLKSTLNRDIGWNQGCVRSRPELYVNRCRITLAFRRNRRRKVEFRRPVKSSSWLWYGVLRIHK